jgi:hypothetical protein
MPTIMKGQKRDSKFGISSSKGFGMSGAFSNKRISTAKGASVGRPRTAAMMFEAADAGRPQTGAHGLPGGGAFAKKNSLAKFAPTAAMGGRAVSAGF